MRLALCLEIHKALASYHRQLRVIGKKECPPRGCRRRAAPLLHAVRIGRARERICVSSHFSRSAWNPIPFGATWRPLLERYSVWCHFSGHGIASPSAMAVPKPPPPPASCGTKPDGVPAHPWKLAPNPMAFPQARERGTKQNGVPARRRATRRTGPTSFVHPQSWCTQLWSAHFCR